MQSAPWSHLLFASILEANSKTMVTGSKVWSLVSEADERYCTSAGPADGKNSHSGSCELTLLTLRSFATAQLEAQPDALAERQGTREPKQRGAAGMLSRKMPRPKVGSI